MTQYVSRVLLLAMTVVVGAGSASSGDRTAVMVFPTGAASAQAKELALSNALGESGVPVADLEALFVAAPGENAAVGLAKEGRDAFDNLDLELAAKKLIEALNFLNKNPALADAKQLAELNVWLATVALQNGAIGKSKATDALMRAVVFDPAYVIDTRVLGQDVKKEWARVLAVVEAKPKGTLRFAAPATAARFRNKTLAGNASVPVPPGRHLVQFTRPGFQPAGVYVEVMQDKEAVATTELVPVAEYATVRAKVQPAVGSGSFSPALADAAKALGARYLVLGQADGELEVWDTVAHERSKKVSTAAEVKAFIASRKTVAVSEAGGASSGEVVAEVNPVAKAPLASTRGANPIGQGIAVRAQVSAGTSAALNTNVLGVEVAGIYGFRPNLDLGAQARVPLTAYGVAPGVNARWRFAEDGRLSLAVVGSIDLPLGFVNRGASVGLSVTPGVMASYVLSDKAEIFGGVLASYNHLFYSNPRVVGTGSPGVMVAARGGLSYGLMESMAAYASIDVAGGYEPLRRSIVIGNAGTGIAMTASVAVGFQMRIR